MTSRDRHRGEMGLVTGYLRELRRQGRATTGGGVVVAPRRGTVAYRPARDSDPARRPGVIPKMTA